VANITRLTDKERDKPWRVRIRRKGHKPLTKMFRTKLTAERWARQQEDSIETFDLPLTIEQLKNVFAEFERSMIVERTKAGMARARAQSKAIGRPALDSELQKQIAVRRSSGASAYRVAKDLGIDRHTVVKYARPPVIGLSHERRS
jgi:hypothetical protein